MFRNIRGIHFGYGGNNAFRGRFECGAEFCVNRFDADHFFGEFGGFGNRDIGGFGGFGNIGDGVFQQGGLCADKFQCGYFGIQGNLLGRFPCSDGRNNVFENFSGGFSLLVNHDRHRPFGKVYAFFIFELSEDILIHLFRHVGEQRRNHFERTVEHVVQSVNYSFVIAALYHFHIMVGKLVPDERFQYLNNPVELIIVIKRTYLFDNL